MSPSALFPGPLRLGLRYARLMDEFFSNLGHLQAPRKRTSLYREMLVVSLTVWGFHFMIVVGRSVIAGVYIDAGSTVARLMVAALGVMAMMGIYAILQRLGTPIVLRRLGYALLLSAPFCVILGATNELLFWLLSNEYQRHQVVLFDLGELAFTISSLYWIFVAWSALYVTLVSATDIRERERRLAVAEADAGRAQLLALRLQINPHFLFNTLNTLSGLVSLDRKATAEAVILNLSAFLRSTLADEPHPMVTLEKEVAAQKLYLAIERARFADRLEIRYRIA